MERMFWLDESGTCGISALSVVILLVVDGAISSANPDLRAATIIRHSDHEVDRNRAPAKSQLSLQLSTDAHVSWMWLTLSPRIGVRRIGAVPQTFKIGDQVSWNSEAGYVSALHKGSALALHED
jgi:hypothetical protein